MTNNTNNKNKVFPSNEILGAFVSADIKSGTAGLSSDINEFVANQYGLDVSAVDIELAQNNDDMVHLSLPYYAGLESVSVQYIDDIELTDISGSELVTLILASVAVGGSVVAASAIFGGVGVAATK